MNVTRKYLRLIIREECRRLHESRFVGREVGQVAAIADTFAGMYKSVAGQLTPPDNKRGHVLRRIANSGLEPYATYAQRIVTSLTNDPHSTTDKAHLDLSRPRDAREIFVLYNVAR